MSDVMLHNDPEGAVSITRNIFWVGFQESGRLRCNPYLLVDRECAVMFDPGSIPDFPQVMRKVIDIVDPGVIELVILHHQDPDVCGCMPVLEDVIDRPDLKVAVHTNTRRLVQHLGFQSDMISVEQEDWQHRLSSGDTLEFLWIPYAHAPGAIVTWHPATGSLFSGDLFGAVDTEGDIFSTDGYPEGVNTFHQAYMPSNAILRRAIEQIEHLPIQRILPQHGNVLEGAAVQAAIEHLKALPCGIDLLD